MKKIFTLLLSSLAVFAMNAQTVDLTGVVWTDFDGETHDLKQLQDDGYTIIMDFWATWCGPCLASIPGIEKAMDDFGPQGDQTYIIFSVETDQSTFDEAEIIEAYGIHNPVIIEEDNEELLGEFDYGGSIPYFVTICPDGSWTSRTGGIGSNPAPILNPSCASASTIVNDARVLLGGDDVGFECPSSPYDAAFTLRNIGTNNLTSAEIEVSINGTATETINWTGDLAKFETEDLNVAGIEFFGFGTQDVEFTVLSANGGTDDNDLNNVASFSKSFPFVDELELTLEIDLDAYAEETGVIIEDANGGEILNIAEMTYDGMNNTTVTEPFTLTSFEGCYKITITDSYGDGLNGEWRVKNASGDVLLSRLSGFTTSQESNLYASADTDGDGANLWSETAAGSDPNDPSSTPATVLSIVNNDLIKGMNVYPNPTSDVLNIDVTATSNVTLSIELVDVLGKVVKTTNANNGVATFNVANVNAGIYFVNVSENGTTVATSTVAIK